MDERVTVAPVGLPDLPGFLTFREAPAVVEAFAGLRQRPDLGLAPDVPAIGVAKNVLVGAGAEPGARRGDSAPLIYEGEVVGAALRTRPAACRSPRAATMRAKQGLPWTARAAWFAPR